MDGSSLENPIKMDDSKGTIIFGNAHISCINIRLMDTGSFPPPKKAVNKVQETLHFRYLKLWVRVTWVRLVVTLPGSDRKKTLKMAGPQKERLVFQQPIFRGYVSVREGS